MKRLTIVLMVMLGASFVSGCLHWNPSAPKQASASLKKDCYGFKKNRPTAEDVSVISPRLAKDILGNNLNGAKVCNWK